MRIYGQLELDGDWEELITNISTDANLLEGDIYYTDNDVACIYNIFNNEYGVSEDWLPWDCEVNEHIWEYHGKYYEEEEAPEEAREVNKVSVYKEGKLIKEYFEEY